MATRYAELVERLRDLAGLMEPEGNYNTSALREAAAAITALEAEVRNMHRRAQKAEGRVSAGVYLVELWQSITGTKRDYLTRTVLADVHRCLSRRRAASIEAKP